MEEVKEQIGVLNFSLDFVLELWAGYPLPDITGSQSIGLLGAEESHVAPSYSLTQINL